MSKHNAPDIKAIVKYAFYNAISIKPKNLTGLKAVRVILIILNLNI
jgi:hypothetical protein